jgi:hypothetical protein
VLIEEELRRNWKKIQELSVKLKQLGTDDEMDRCNSYITSIFNNQFGYNHCLFIGDAKAKKKYKIGKESESIDSPSATSSISLINCRDIFFSMGAARWFL